MVEFLSKFRGRGIRIYESSLDSRYQSIDFLQYLAYRCSLSDVIMSYRFLCVEHAAISP